MSFVKTSFFILLLLSLSCKRQEEEKPKEKEYLSINLESSVESNVIGLLEEGGRILVAYNRIDISGNTPGIAIVDAQGNLLQKKLFEDETGFELRELLLHNGQLLMIGQDAAATLLWIVKTDLQFNKISRHTFPVGTGVSLGRSLMTNELLVTGFADYSGNREGILISVDAAMSQVQVQRFGGMQNESSVDLVRSPNGSLHMLAYTYSKGAGDRDFWWLKRRDTSFVNEKTFGTDGYEEPQKMIFKGEQIYMAGHSSGFGHPEHNAYLVKCDTQGNLLWQKNFGGPNHDGFQWVQTTSDGNILCAGRSMQFYSIRENIYLVRTDTDGNLLAEKRFGEESLNENPTGALELGGRFFVAVNAQDEQGKRSGKVYHLPAF